MTYGDFYCVIKHLILLKIQNIMDINADLLQWFTQFLIKSLLLRALGQRTSLHKIKFGGRLLKVKLFQTNNQLKNYTNQLLKNLKSKKYTYLLKTIFRVPISFLIVCFDIYSKNSWVVSLKD